MTEDNITLERPIRLKRLRMRAWRRGMKEMDMILGPFVDTKGESLTDAQLSALEILMDRQDQQLFLWVSGASAAPSDAEPTERDIVDIITSGFD